MAILSMIIDFIMHIDKHLAEITLNYGMWTYLILFGIIFCETGLVVTPFLPGDSLLFVIGALSASMALDFKMAWLILVIAAIGGNTVNFFIGYFVGHKLEELDRSHILRRLIKEEYLLKTHAFYEKHGGKAMILSRFVPIIRTFAPFVAGIGKMNYIKATIYNTVGGIAWVSIFMLGGYYFGNIPTVKHNFTYVIMGIIVISLLPAMVAWIKTKREKGIVSAGESE